MFPAPTGLAETLSTYCGNGTTSACVATVTLGAATIEAGSGITCVNSTYSSNVATSLSIKPPGILAGCTDAAGYPLTVNAASVTGNPGLSVDPHGGFTIASGSGTYSFTFKAQNSQGTVATNAATVTVNFPRRMARWLRSWTEQTRRPLSPTIGGLLRKIARSTSTQSALRILCRRAVLRSPLGELPPSSERISTPATCRSWQPAARGRSPANRARL